MEITIDEAWLKEQGVEVTETNAEELVDAAMDEFELRVGEEIASRLTDKQRAEFEKLEDEDARFDLLESALPDYDKIVENKFKGLSAELKASDEKLNLLRSWAEIGRD